MEKGYNHYMCKKSFHPASRVNLKRVWIAEQKAEYNKKKEKQLTVHYEKEQAFYRNNALLSKESKDKLSVNFMYVPSPGMKKGREREDDGPKYKFDWQRKFNAPREDYCKSDLEIRDQPFGIQVRNVRCIKCHKMGHVNTDKECRMYHRASDFYQTGPQLDPLLLVQQRRENDPTMKKSALSTEQRVRFSHSQDFIPSEDEEHILSVRQKRRLLRKRKALEKKDEISKSNKKKMKKEKRKQKVKDGSSSDSEESEKERKSCKVKKRPKKDKDKKKTVEKVLGRTIQFIGRNSTTVPIERLQHQTVISDSLSDNYYKRPARVTVEEDDAKYKPGKEEDGMKYNREGSKDRNERNKRKSSSEGNYSLCNKKQKK
jgi:CBF1 interacting corepressor